jgi:hypothetical protein
MPRHLAVWLIACVVATGTNPAAQKIVGPDEFSRAMKTIGTAFDGVKKSIESKSYVEAKTPLALTRQIMASSRPFWTANQNPDAARMTKDMVAKLDALDKALSPSTVDAAAVAAALQDVNRGCDSCHALYREGNEQTGYRIKSSR